MRRITMFLAIVVLTLAAGWSAAQSVPVPDVCYNPTTGACEGHMPGFACPEGYAPVVGPCPAPVATPVPAATPVPIPTVGPVPTSVPGPDPIPQYGGWLATLLRALGDKITWGLPLTLLGTLGTILTAIGLLRRLLAQWGGIILPAKTIQVLTLVLGAIGTAITDATHNGAVTGTVLAALIEGLISAYLAMKTWDAIASTKAKAVIKG